jgi:hypothetical protein
VQHSLPLLSPRRYHPRPAPTTAGSNIQRTLGDGVSPGAKVLRGFPKGTASVLFAEPQPSGYCPGRVCPAVTLLSEPATAAPTTSSPVSFPRFPDGSGEAGEAHRCLRLERCAYRWMPYVSVSSWPPGLRLRLPARLVTAHPFSEAATTQLREIPEQRQRDCKQNLATCKQNLATAELERTSGYGFRS